MTLEFKRSPWLKIEAVALIVLGLAALLLPLAAGVAAGVVFGLVLTLSGVAGLIAALRGREHSPIGWVKLPGVSFS